MGLVAPEEIVRALAAAWHTANPNYWLLQTPSINDDKPDQQPHVTNAR